MNDTTTPAATAQAVLDQLNQALARRDFAGASQLFAEESFWRDLVLLTWNHFGYSNPTADIGIASGTLVYDQQDPAQPLVGQNALPVELLGLLLFADLLDLGELWLSTLGGPQLGEHLERLLVVTVVGEPPW